MFREYKIYTSLSYKILVLAVFPIIAIVLMNLLGLAKFDPAMLIAVVVASDIIMDSFAFSGICKKHGSATNLIQSSNGGEAFVRRLVIADLFIKVAKTALVFWAGAYAYLLIEKDCVRVILGALLAMLVILVGSFIERHMTVLQATVIIGSFSAAAAQGIYLFVIDHMADYLVAVAIALGVLVAAGVAFTYYYIMKAYKNSFVD